MAAPFEIDTAGVDDELLAFRLGSMSIIAFGVPLLLSDQALSSFAKPPSAVHGPLTAALSLVGLGWLLQKSWRHLSTAVKTPDSPTQTSSEDSKLAAPVEQPAAATDVATDAEAVHPSNSGTPDGEVLDPMDIPPAPTVPVPSEAPEEPQAEAPGPHLQNSRTETGDVVAPALHTDDSAPQKYAQPVQNEPGWETVDRHPPTATNGIPSAPPASLVHGMPSAPPASLVFSKLAPEAELADRGRHTQLSGHNDDGSTANEARTQLASLGDGTRIEQAQEALRRSRPHCRPYGPLTDTLENFDTMETRLKDGRVSTGQPPEYFADVFIKKWHNEWWPMIQKQGPMRLGDSEMNPISFLVGRSVFSILLLCYAPVLVMRILIFAAITEPSLQKALLVQQRLNTHSMCA